ncbi:MAG TPA: transporter [Planctomycetaceae bacterium]|nr:transporter [Planctomycetaceae bacterium]
MDLPPAPGGQLCWPAGGIACALALGFLFGLLLAPPISADEFPAPLAARPKGPTTNTYPTGSGSLIDKAPPETVVIPPEAPGEEPVYKTLPPKRLFDGRPIPVGDPLEHPRVQRFERWDPDRFGYSMRPNLVGQPITNEWDFGNIISTDRPDFTDSPFTVGQGVTVIETGYTYRQIHAPDYRLNRQTAPEFLMRLGLTDDFELRFRWNGFVQNQVGFPAGMGMTQNGTDDLNLGFKWEMHQQDNWIPMLTLVAGSTIPGGTNQISANQMQPYANVVYGWGLKRWLYLKGSTGVDFTHGSSVALQDTGFGLPFVGVTRDNQNVWHESISVLYQVSKHYGGFSEWFCFFENGGANNLPSHYIDTGVYIYLTPNMQLDARIGQRLSSRTDEFFTGAGFSIRF